MEEPIKDKRGRLLSIKLKIKINNTTSFRIESLIASVIWEIYKCVNKLGVIEAITAWALCSLKTRRQLSQIAGVLAV
jgi:hypothetical protein